MRSLKFVLVVLAGLAGLLGALVVMFRRNPRIGSSYMNSVVNPALIERGLSGRGRAEIGTLEHFGRRSGTRYLTPVYPMPTADGFEIMVPLGSHSQWAQNVLAAGHCRLQLHDTVLDLDEPVMKRPCELGGLPRPIRRFEEFLGFEYMALRRFDSAPGSLDVAETEDLPELVTAAT